jgi:hypothetical protein
MLIITAVSLLAGCGTYVPNIQDFYEVSGSSPTAATADLVDAIVKQIRCEITNAVQTAVLYDWDSAGMNGKRDIDWFDSWAATALLTLTIEEKTTLNPGLSLNTPIHNGVTNFVGEVVPGVTPGVPSNSVASALSTTYAYGPLISPQSYAFGFGGTASADATRKETLSLYFDFKQLTDRKSLIEAKARIDQGSGNLPLCNDIFSKNGILVQSDLKLKEWLMGALFPAHLPGTETAYQQSLEMEAKKDKKDVIGHEITFVIIYGGNVTPSWKLVRVSANQGSTLFSAQRSKTQDLTISMGPQSKDALATAAQNTVLASQIGQAVANSIKGSQP